MVNVGTVTGNDSRNIIINVFNAINVYNKPVLVNFFNNGQGFGVAYKYSGGQYGEMICMRFGQGQIFSLSRNDGTDIVSSFSGTSV